MGLLRDSKIGGWGLPCGIERLAGGKYEITDIRWLYENDPRLLSQFRSLAAVTCLRWDGPNGAHP